MRVAERRRGRTSSGGDGAAPGNNVGVSRAALIRRTGLGNVVRRGRASSARVVARTSRLTVAALASYLVAQRWVDDPRPITAALTALLIVQVTLVGTLADTARRMASVIVGVGIAIAVSAFIGFTWWSLAGIIAVALLAGQLLRLGSQLLEVPISAMLVLAAGGAGAQATDRIIETAIGALVGVLVNVVVPPAPRTRSAGAEVERFAAALAGLLERVAQELADRAPTREEAGAWLVELRHVGGTTAALDRVLNEARESRRLNARAVGTNDPTPDLRSGLDALEHSAVALRAVFRSIADGAVPARAADKPEDERDDEADADLRTAVATVLNDLARALCGFGALIRAESESAGQPHPVELAEALDAVHETRARLTELMLVDPQSPNGLWQLRGSLLAGVDRVLAELDLEERARRRERQTRAAVRSPAVHAAQRLRATTRRAVADSPVLRRPRRS